ncbi:MAG TPA: lamin tail domain-containing protein [Flavisolibacter sp.]|nr:lamin tail domain-containing protein [Flavisolibacter sp.]
MKTLTCKSFLLFIALVFLYSAAVAQRSGKVVINEYMPWTSNGCGTTAEFVELLNFGPGPVDIGCYVLTTGKYAITIPPNTFLQPGEFYVIAGQNFIPTDCANIDSVGKGITADLNWNSCNCTSAPIPTTGDGLLTDGGSGNTPLVLLDPELTIIDAVVRSLPAETASPITTSSVNGSCGPKSFNLNTMAVKYEQLGMSAGRGNSFARTTDGDCSWVKDPQQSANASNNRSGDLTDIRYSFSLLEPTACATWKGRVNVYVEHSNYAAIFPMSYTIAWDQNKNGIFDQDDSYSTYHDSTAPMIEVGDLVAGRYRMTVASANGCYLKTFEFTILECYPVLPVQLEFFKYAGQQYGNHRLEWKLANEEKLQTITVQKARKNEPFVDEKQVSAYSGENGYYATEVNGTDYSLFRLRIQLKNGEVFYSPVVSLNSSSFLVQKSWPNPASTILNLQLTSATSKNITYTIFHATGKAVNTGQIQATKGQSVYQLNVAHLLPGLYQLQLVGLWENAQPISLRFVKH